MVVVFVVGFVFQLRTSQYIICFERNPSLTLWPSVFAWAFDEDMTKSKGKDPLEGLGGPMTKARARKPRKLFNKCCPYYLNTSPSFKEKSPRL